MNTTPATMTLAEFSQASADLARRADECPHYSPSRAALLDELGRLWTAQGFPEVGQTWHDAADHCRKGPLS